MCLCRCRGRVLSRGCLATRLGELHPQTMNLAAEHLVIGSRSIVVGLDNAKMVVEASVLSNG